MIERVHYERGTKRMWRPSAGLQELISKDRVGGARVVRSPAQRFSCSIFRGQPQKNDLDLRGFSDVS